MSLKLPCQHADLPVRPFPASLHRPSIWPMVLARLRYWAWTLLCKALAAIVYFQVISEGWRLSAEFFGQRVSRIPGFGWMNEYEETHRLDLANITALGLMVIVFMLLGETLRLWLYGGTRGRISPEKYRAFIFPATAVIVGGDAYLFFRALGEMSWAGGAGSFNDVVVTVLWIGLLAVVSFVSVNLSQAIKDLKVATTSKDFS